MSGAVPKALANNCLGRLFFPVLSLLATFTFFVSSHTPAEARSAQCKRLETQLASLGRGGSSGGSLSSRYASAIVSQKRHLQRLDRTMRRRGCRANSTSGPKACVRLSKTRSRMIRNLKSLQLKGKVLGGGGSSVSKSKRRIRAKMRRAGCFSQTVRKNDSFQKLKRPKKARSVVTLTPRRLKRNQTRKQKMRNAQLARLQPEAKVTRSDLAGIGSWTQRTYRTMCVRTCDGAYFPVSFSTTIKNFVADANACNAMCPGAKTRLFYYDTMRQTPDQMISARSGKPYARLDVAYSYRKTFNPLCTCNHQLTAAKARNRSKKRKRDTRATKIRRERQVIAQLARPAWRSDFGQDPQTRMGSAATLLLTDITTINASEIAPREKRAVREIKIAAYEPAQSQ